MKIYTKTGDAGTTGLFGGPRVSKDDARICAYGSVDELNAVLGTARSTRLSEKLDQMLDAIQHQLFSIGAELATPEPEPSSGCPRPTQPGSQPTLPPACTNSVAARRSTCRVHCSADFAMRMSALST
jgi:hypothetical protein